MNETTTGTSIPTCAMVQARLTALKDGELSENEATAVHAHMASCEECRTALDEIVSLGALLPAWKVGVADMADRILASLPQPEPPVVALATPEPSDPEIAEVLSALVGEIKSLRGEVKALRREVAELRSEKTPRTTLRTGAHLLPYADPKEVPLNLS